MLISFVRGDATHYLILRHGFRRVAQNVRNLEQILTEALNAEQLCIVNLFRESSSDVFTFRQCTFVFIL